MRSDATKKNQQSENHREDRYQALCYSRIVKCRSTKILDYFLSGKLKSRAQHDVGYISISK